MYPGRLIGLEPTLIPVARKSPNHKSLLSGLSRNPVAVIETFYQFIRSSLLQLNGVSQIKPQIIQIIAEPPIQKKPSQAEYRTNHLGAGNEPAVKLTGRQGAQILESMNEANCFVILHHNRGNIATGDFGKCIALFDRLL